jgi:hypothetical protein
VDRRLYIEYLGDSIELSRGETLVGRDVGCTLRFNDPSVSRRHLRFVHRADAMFVEDIGSSNGTLLNGRMLRAPARITEGDVISVGSRTLTVRVSDGDEEQPSTLVLCESLAEQEPHTRPRRMPVSVTVPHQIREITGDGITARAKTSQLPRVVPDFDSGRIGSSPTVPPAMIPIERRRHDRIPMELRLIYVSEELEIEANTSDLSQSGVFVRTQILDPVGTPCELTILIDGGPALKVKGMVRRVVEQGNERGEPCGLGVELTDLGDKERAWIDIAAVRITS